MQAQMEDHEGYCFALLKIASQESVDRASRQLAAIQLKNIVKRRWHRSAACQRKGIPEIPESDKREITANVYECVVRYVHAKVALSGCLVAGVAHAHPLCARTKSTK